MICGRPRSIRRAIGRLPAFGTGNRADVRFCAVMAEGETDSRCQRQTCACTKGGATESTCWRGSLGSLAATAGAAIVIVRSAALSSRLRRFIMIVLWAAARSVVRCMIIARTCASLVVLAQVQIIEPDFPCSPMHCQSLSSQEFSFDVQTSSEFTDRYLRQRKLNGSSANLGGVCSGAKKSHRAELMNVVQDGDMHAYRL